MIFLYEVSTSVLYITVTIDKAQPPFWGQKGEDMKDVNIYIHTEYSGSFKSGTGKYHVMLEILEKDAKGNLIPYTNEQIKGAKPVMGIVKDTTRNRLDLLALREALSHMIKPSRITIYTASEYITNACSNGWAEAWESRGYRKNGKPVKHADLWRSVMELSKEHAVTYVHAEKTSYTKVQAAALKKIKEEKDESG